MELYERLTPTKMYTVYKTGMTQGDVTCSMCGKSPEILGHVLLGCSALAHSKYLERHNVVLKVAQFLLGIRLQCPNQATSYLRHQRFGMFQFNGGFKSSLACDCSRYTTFTPNTLLSRQTEWTLNLWTTRLRRCGLWRRPVHG